MRTILLLLLGISLKALPQLPTKELFRDNKVVELTLACNLRDLMLDVDETRAQFHPASLSYLDDSKTPITLSVQVKTRGHFRRLKENCSFPPIRIKFSEQSIHGTIFQGQSKLKLVSNCKMGNKKFEQYIIKEYLVYKAYNLITPFSFNVRLVRINFVDITDRIKNFTTHAFFIEDNDDVAARNGGKIVNTQGIHQDAVNQQSMNEMAVFQYFIGNTDWSVLKLHNTELVLIDEARPLIVLPYDFDFCGIVNPPYTKPPEILPIQHVTERLYRGFCKVKAELEPVLEKYIQLRPAIQGVFEQDSILEPKEKKRILKYIDEFYRTLDNPREKDREFYELCRKD